MRHKLFSGVAVLALLMPCLVQAAPDEILKYSAADGSSLVMNVFRADAEDRTGQAAVFYFGGGWRVGNPQQFFPFCEALQGQGITCFVPDYRVSSRQGTDGVDALEDARAAFNWVVTNSAEFGVDKKQIYVGGGSAGGHLAASVAVIPDASLKARPIGMLLFNPAVDLGNSARLNAIFRNAVADYSPIEFVRSGLPPAWVVHGTGDKIVPHATVVDFCQRMDSAGNQCQLLSFDGAGHGFFNAGRPAYDEVLAALLSHLD